MAKTLSIRGVEDSVAFEFSAGAAVRGITQAEYLKRLIELRGAAFFHVGCRDMASFDATDMKRVAQLAESVNKLIEVMTNLGLEDRIA